MPRIPRRSNRYAAQQPAPPSQAPSDAEQAFPGEEPAASDSAQHTVVPGAGGVDSAAEAPDTAAQPAYEAPTATNPVVEPATGRRPILSPIEQMSRRGSASEAGDVEHSPISVVNEPAPAGSDYDDEDDDEYRWHTGVKRDSGAPDAVEFVDVHKAFGRSKILRGLNLGLPEGKISMILGPSGTGKSVCIKHMVGLLYPDQGDVFVHGESVPDMVDDELFDMRKKFGVLFQDGALFGSMNVFDNTAFPLRQHTDKGEDEISDIVTRRLSEVGLASAGDKMPNELSGGMRKRAGFARALVLDPDIVLFDEPDSGLDPVRTALLGELIQEIHKDMTEDFEKRGKDHLPAFCLVTHDIMTARRVAEHISVLWKGRIVESGPANELFNSDNAFVRQFLSGESQGPLGME
ncbi:MAG: ATP-binding cassette domain-containing protein [Solirubrobacteraceae bacterium]